MSNIPPPPVPESLRKRLKHYPEYLRVVQDDLIERIASAAGSIPVFEQAIWALEATLSSFMADAAEELRAIEANGDVEAIEKAKQKRSTFGAARMNMGGMPELFEYCETYYPSGYIDRDTA